MSRIEINIFFSAWKAFHTKTDRWYWCIENSTMWASRKIYDISFHNIQLVKSCCHVIWWAHTFVGLGSSSRQILWQIAMHAKSVSRTNFFSVKASWGHQLYEKGEEDGDIESWGRHYFKARFQYFFLSDAANSYRKLSISLNATWGINFWSIKASYKVEILQWKKMRKWERNKVRNAAKYRVFLCVKTRKMLASCVHRVRLC